MLCCSPIADPLAVPGKSGGHSNKLTSLQSTLSSNNIAGLYKQQTTNYHFKVSSPSKSAYWSAGVPGLQYATEAATSCCLQVMQREC